MGILHTVAVVIVGCMDHTTAGNQMVCSLNFHWGFLVLPMVLAVVDQKQPYAGSVARTHFVGSVGQMGPVPNLFEDAWQKAPLDKCHKGQKIVEDNRQQGLSAAHADLLEGTAEALAAQLDCVASF